MSKPPTRAGRTKASKDVKGKSAQAEKQPATLLEIVPGKFNENDWNNMLEIEDSQEFVWEIVDELFGNAMRIVYDNYIKSQTIPYMINEARKAILHIIEWQFLTNDVDDDLCYEWVEDKEPESCMIDSWAQGFVETIQLEPEPTKEEGDLMNESSVANEEKLEFLEELNRLGDKSSLSTPKTQLSTVSKVRSLDEEVRLKVEANKQKQAKMRAKRRMLDAIARKKVEAEEQAARILKERDESLITQEIKKEEPILKAPVPCQSLLKSLLGRPAPLREIEIDSLGQIQSMAKLDLDKMPTSGVKVRFSVINENNQKTHISGGGVLETSPVATMSITASKKAHTQSNNSVKPSGSISPTASSSMSSKLNRLRKSPPRRTSKIANFIDQEDEMMIEPASGVIFSMMNSTRAGPKRSMVSLKHQLMFEKSETHLRPVRQFDSESASITRSSIEQILSSNPNNIPLPVRKPPIPPINSSSTTVN